MYVELTQATPPAPGERFGVFRDFSHLESNMAIRITKIDGENLWVAGDGKKPIRTRRAPANAKTIRRASLDSGH